MKKRDRLDRTTVLSQLSLRVGRPALRRRPSRSALPASSITPTRPTARSRPTSRARCSASRRCGLAAGEELTWNYGIDPWFDVRLMRIGLTYDLRDDYLAQGFSDEAGG